MNTTCFETQRIKHAQDNLYKWCIQNLPVGRQATDEDKEAIERVVESNRKSREVVFGKEEWVWYPVYKGFVKGGL